MGKGHRGIRRFAFAGLLIAATGGAASADTDPFQCYQSRTAAGTPAFSERTVSLKSKYGDGSFQVIGPRSLCNPAFVDGSVPHDGTAHLECYKVTPNSFTAFGSARRSYSNDFGTQTVEIGSLRRLCVPTRKNGEPSTLEIDHFACFNTVEPPAVERSTTILDQFQLMNETVVKPKLVCTTAAKNGEPVLSVSDRLVCFKVFPETAFPPRTATTSNQFGNGTLDVNATGLLCLPSQELSSGGGKQCSEPCGECYFCQNGECVFDEQQCGER